MSSGVRRQVMGSFNGTGANIDVKVPQFRPRKVEVLNVSGICTGIWTESMADGAVLKTVDSGAGTTDIVFVASATGITPLADGFRLGADTDLNVSGETVHWIASE